MLNSHVCGLCIYHGDHVTTLPMDVTLTIDGSTSNSCSALWVVTFLRRIILSSHEVQSPLPWYYLL